MKCPGQDTQYWNTEAIYEVECPECRAMVEFYKDDTTRKCPECRHRFVNPKLDFGCATYCQFADQCLGTLPEEFVIQQDNLLKDKVAVEMKRYFRNDFKSIALAMKVAHYAEKIGKATEGANLAAVLCSAYLLNIGYAAAQEKGSDVAKKDLEREGPRVASEILNRLGADETLINQVCSLIGKEMPAAADDDVSFQIVNDAYQIAQLERELKDAEIPSEKIEKRLVSIFSDTGRMEAEAVLAAVRS